MTAPRAAIVFNATIGSDTAASGLGPATAISGTAAAHTGGSASTTITLTGSPDLSGVQAGDLLWLKTASGRQFSVIASADNSAKTVTVDDSFTIAEASAVNYAIGGKRATWDNADSRLLFTADVKAGWTIETETDQTVSSAIQPTTKGNTTSGVITVRSNVPGTQRAVVQTANVEIFYWYGTAYNWDFVDLWWQNSNETKTAAVSHKFNISGGTYRFLRNRFGHATNRLYHGMLRSGLGSYILLLDCECAWCSDIGLNLPGMTVTIRGSWIHDNSTHGVMFSGGTLQVMDSLISDNGLDGVYHSTATGGGLIIERSTIHKNGGDGIDVSAASTLLGRLEITAANITANTGYGIRAKAGQMSQFVFADYNNFGSASSTPSTANSSGNMLNIDAGPHDLNVDPQYTDADAGDFSVGTNVQAKGFPDATRYIGANQSATRSYVDIGAAQRQEYVTADDLPSIAASVWAYAKRTLTR